MHRISILKVLLFLCVINIFFLLFSVKISFPKYYKLNTPITALASTQDELEKKYEIADTFFTQDVSMSRDKLNILLLGLDGRKNDERPRCDAIHMFNIDYDNNKLNIISVPRGTRIDRPNISTQSAYIGNLCHMEGIENTVKEISQITGKKPDIVIKVGFSQVLGIIRNFNLPSTPTLQFLRNRRYAIGDNQRSHNQALFLKEMILKYTSVFASLPKGMKYFLFKNLDIDINFDQAYEYFKEFYYSNIYADENNINLVIKPEPNPYIKEIEYDPDDYDDGEWKDSEFLAYQKDLVNYLSNLLLKSRSYLDNNRKDLSFSLLKRPYEQKLWLQIEEEGIRDQIHYDLLMQYCSSLTQGSCNSEVLDFIYEMDTFGKTEYKEKGQNMLEL